LQREHQNVGAERGGHRDVGVCAVGEQRGEGGDEGPRGGPRVEPKRCCRPII
jgi:hypothetical protein